MTTDPDGKPYAHNAEQAEAHRLARAEADAELAAVTAERDQLRAELVTERARLDWLLSYDGVDWVLWAHKNRKLLEREQDNRALLAVAIKEASK